MPRDNLENSRQILGIFAVAQGTLEALFFWDRKNFGKFFLIRIHMGNSVIIRDNLKIFCLDCGETENLFSPPSNLTIHSQVLSL